MILHEYLLLCHTLCHAILCDYYVSEAASIHDFADVFIGFFEHLRYFPHLLMIRSFFFRHQFRSFLHLLLLLLLLIDEPFLHYAELLCIYTKLVHTVLTLIELLMKLILDGILGVLTVQV